MFFFNLVFALCGLCIVAFAGLCLYTLMDSSNFVQDLFLYPIVVFLVIGGIIVFIAFFGCCGSVKEHHCMLTSFGVLLVALFVIELAVVAAGYFYRDEISHRYKDLLSDGVKEYNTNDDAKKLIDDLQLYFRCCGVDGPSDYNALSMPDSCCDNFPNSTHGGPDAPQTCTIASAYTRGCYRTSQTEFASFLWAFGIFGACVSVIQLIGIVFAFCLARSIRRGYEIV